MALMKEINKPEKTVRAMLTTPPDNFLNKIRPAPIQMHKMAILVINIVLALEPVVLKNRYSKTAHSMPATIPKIQSDFCFIK